MNNSPIDHKLRFTAMWCSLINLIVLTGEIFALLIITITCYGFLLSPILLLVPILLGLWILPWKLWQINRNKHPFIDETVKRALNFTLSGYLYLAIIFTIWLKTYFIGMESVVPDTGGWIPNRIQQVSMITEDRFNSSPSLSYFDRSFDQNSLNFSSQILVGHFGDPPILFGAWRPHYSDYDRQPAIIHFFMSAIEVFYERGLYLIPLLLIFHAGAIVFGSIQAARGNVYKYPLTIRFFK